MAFDQARITAPGETDLVTAWVPVTSPVTTVVPIIRPGYSASPVRARSSPSIPPAARRAPRALRVSVTLLFLVLIATLGSSLYARGHPKWLNALRNFAPSVQPIEPTSSLPTIRQVVLVSSTATAVLYRVSTKSYSIIVTVDHPTWIVVRSPASSSSLLVAQTLSPGAGPLRIALHASASITVSAQTQSITVATGSHLLDVIHEPTLGVAYTFQPKSSSS